MNYEIKPSNIEGLGVFATQDIKKGTKIPPVLCII